MLVQNTLLTIGLGGILVAVGLWQIERRRRQQLALQVLSQEAQTKTQIEETSLKFEQARSEYQKLQNEHAGIVQELRITQQAHQNQVAQIKLDYDRAQTELNNLKQIEHNRVSQHEALVSELKAALNNLRLERTDQLEREKTAAQEREQRLKRQWLEHEQNVQNLMQQLTLKHNIEFVDKEQFPYRGKPDHCIKLGEEFVIFDSKSPQTDNLTHFPSYIRAQAEAAAKYIQAANVRKDIFLVVPSSAVSALSQLFFLCGTYRVFVVTPDSLESILILLKRFYDYEFAESLSPEDREAVINLIGRMAHTMKRRIQIDQFFAKEFIGLLTSAENLPAELLAEAQKVERSSKLNPPLEKRTKLIPAAELINESQKIAGKAIGQNIDTGVNLAAALESVPLQPPASNVPNSQASTDHSHTQVPTSANGDHVDDSPSQSSR